MSDFENYSLEDPDYDSSDSHSEENLNSEGNSLPGSKKIWLAFFRTLLQPVEGWKALKRLRLTSQRFNSIVFFPSLALATATAFISAMTWQEMELNQALPLSLNTFCGFFFGYFCTLILIKFLLPPSFRGLFDTDFGKNMTGAAITSLALFDVLCQAFPMLQPIFAFLPAWTIFSISKGVRILGVEEKYRVQTATLLSVLTIGLPIGISFLMKSLI